MAKVWLFKKAYFLHKLVLDAVFVQSINILVHLALIFFEQYGNVLGLYFFTIWQITVVK